MKVEDEWKEAIFKRDRYICQYCGRDGCRDLTAYMLLQIDHFISPKLDGSLDACNLVTCCAICNHMKGQQVFTTIDDAKRAIAKYYEAVKLHWEKNIKPLCGTVNAGVS